LSWWIESAVAPSPSLLVRSLDAARRRSAAGCLRRRRDELQQARATVAGSLAHYLADHDEHRLGVCADDTCGWLFIDESPAGRRRWCDMRTCGNRAKVARHRARARSTSSAAMSA
jgi:predicted RNA-binding Zn ribbon-like protein